jgi:hypothetical protein
MRVTYLGSVHVANSETLTPVPRASPQPSPTCQLQDTYEQSELGAPQEDLWKISGSGRTSRAQETRQGETEHLAQAPTIGHSRTASD